jgi:hypothetical protein
MTLSQYVTGLQDMLNSCLETATYLTLNFSVNKCHCISFGESSALKLDYMHTGSYEVDWCSSMNTLESILLVENVFHFTLI